MHVRVGDVIEDKPSCCASEQPAVALAVASGSASCAALETFTLRSALESVCCECDCGAVVGLTSGVSALLGLRRWFVGPSGPDMWLVLRCACER